MNALLFMEGMNYMVLAINRIEELRKTPMLSEGNDSEFANYGIEFQNVQFFYNNIPVLNDLNINISSHKLAALVGPS